MGAKEINYKKSDLEIVIDQLRMHHAELVTIQKNLQQTDESVLATLLESSNQYYQERSNIILKSMEDSLTAFTALIGQAEQAKEAAFKTDLEAGNQMLT